MCWEPFLGATAAAVLLSLHGSPQAQCELPFGQRAQGAAAEHFTASAVHEKLGKPVHMQNRMHTTMPSGAKSDIRIVDIIDTEAMFHEIKIGSVRYTQTTAHQILKDAHIVKHNRGCKGYVWEFFAGKNGEAKVDPKVLKKLEENGIKYVIHEHKSTPDAATQCPHCSEEDVLKNVHDSAPKGGSEQMAAVKSQATVLKAVGAVNLAVALLSLGAGLILCEHINVLERKMPELSQQCGRFKATLDKIDVELGAALAQPSSTVRTKSLMKAASEEFEILHSRFNQIIHDHDAKQRQSQAEVCKIVSVCTVLMGLVLTVASVGCLVLCWAFRLPQLVAWVSN